MSKAVLHLALTIDRELAADYDDYLDQCAADQARGYRPEFCEHGTYQWTDYDNICGGCEDGITMGDPVQRRTRALVLAHDRNDQVHALMDAYHALHRLGHGDLLRADLLGERIGTLLATGHTR